MFKYLKHRFGSQTKPYPLENVKSSFTAQPQRLFPPQTISETSSLVSLEQYLSFWKLGDWASLSKIQLSDLAAHPDRTQIALLVAVAYEQQNQFSKARAFIQSAEKWGATKQQIAKILISGVHNTLGRARLTSGDNTEATNHFALSLPNEISEDTKRQQLADVRMAHQQKLLNIAERTNLENVKGQIFSTVKIDNNDGASSTEELIEKIKSVVKAESTNIVRQLECYVSIQSYLLHGQIPLTLHGWPISPDFGCYLIQLLEDQSFDLVVEFGSGTSTMLIGRALENIKSRTNISEIHTQQVAFEHLEKYFQQTNTLLSKYCLTEKVELVLAQLEEQLDMFDGNIYKYYCCEKKLESIAQSKNINRILVIVDGPPALTGRHARYLAIPLLIKHFPQAELDILLDDFERHDEKQVVDKWMTVLKKTGRTFQHRKLDFEKGASHLHVDPKI